MITNSGISLNEAAVQLMASEANICNASSETYFGISIRTISPDYYPLECTLAKEITYFTGTYPLYHSTLYGDDIFKNTFILKTGKKAYNTIQHAIKLSENENTELVNWDLAIEGKDFFEKYLNNYIKTIGSYSDSQLSSKVQYIQLNGEEMNDGPGIGRRKSQSYMLFL